MLNHPWFALVDQSKFEATVESIRRLEHDIIAGYHAPLAKGLMVEAHLQAMTNLPAQGPFDLPEQAATDGILAGIPGNGGGHGQMRSARTVPNPFTLNQIPKIPTTNCRV